MAEFDLLGASISRLSDYFVGLGGLLNLFGSIFGGGSDCPNKLQATQLVAARLQALARILNGELRTTQQGLAFARQEYASCLRIAAYRQSEVDRQGAQLVQKIHQVNDQAAQIALLRQDLNAARAEIPQLRAQLDRIVNSLRNQVSQLTSQLTHANRELTIATNNYHNLLSKYNICEKQLAGSPRCQPVKGCV
jgi:chromosome segregation ATPase